MITPEYLRTNWLALGSDTSQDTLLQVLIDTATKQIREWCGQPLLEEEDHEVIIPQGLHTTARLPFQGVPVELTSFKYRDTPLESWTAAEADTYTVHQDRAGWWLYSSDFLVHAQYQALVTVGYALADMPANLQAACAYAAKELYYATGSSGKDDRFGVAAISDGNASGSVALTLASVQPTVMDMLRPYNIKLRP